MSLHGYAKQLFPWSHPTRLLLLYSYQKEDFVTFPTRSFSATLTVFYRSSLCVPIQMKADSLLTWQRQQLQLQIA